MKQSTDSIRNKSMFMKQRVHLWALGQRFFLWLANIGERGAGWMSVRWPGEAQQQLIHEAITEAIADPNLDVKSFDEQVREEAIRRAQLELRLRAMENL